MREVYESIRSMNWGFTGEKVIYFSDTLPSVTPILM